MNEAESSTTATLPRALSAQTRLLLPFLFERRAADRAAELLAGASTGIARGLWVREPPRKLYRYRLEMTGQLDRFLFSHGEKGKVEGEYLHASGERMRRWLGSLDVDMGTRTGWVGLAATPGAELFLTAHGAGVLSFTFDLGKEVELGSILELNRRLSILTRPGERAPWLSVPWPAGSPPPAPAPDGHHASTTPLGDRLGKPGARFSLAELIAALAEPLRSMGIVPIQESLCVYTVVALPVGVEVDAAANRSWTAPYLAALAEVQSSFQPSEEGRAEPGVPNLFPSGNHWTAATLQGAAHLLATHPSTMRGEDTLAEARDRYFVPYLTALLQRCAVKKAAEEATDMVVREDVKREAVSRLRADVLAFALAGALPEVSVRYALHRYYRMCQEAVDLERNLQQVRGALGDLEAQLSSNQQMVIAQNQRDIAQKAHESQESSHRIHVALVWIEVFIVVAYAAELVKFFVLELPHIESIPMRWVVSFGTVGVGVAALAILKPWRHGHAKGERHGDAAPPAPH
ncbi:MAG TPA: hypothetical protein VFM45_09985 [Anaeromyxobacteraceae bacterium]|nr:hypothetical protein [Anaeromyxobacteraceae bacterium]